MFGRSKPKINPGNQHFVTRGIGARHLFISWENGISSGEKEYPHGNIGGRKILLGKTQKHGRGASLWMVCILFEMYTAATMAEVAWKALYFFKIDHKNGYQHLQVFFSIHMSKLSSYLLKTTSHTHMYFDFPPVFLLFPSNSKINHIHTIERNARNFQTNREKAIIWVGWDTINAITIDKCSTGAPFV